MQLQCGVQLDFGTGFKPPRGFTPRGGLDGLRKGRFFDAKHRVGTFALESRKNLEPGPSEAASEGTTMRERWMRSLLPSAEAARFGAATPVLAL